MYGLKDYAEAAPKIVIYCRTVILAGWLYDEFLMSEILPKDVLRKHVQIYHSTSFDDEKITISNALKEETDIRVVLATSALGCGVDMKSVHFLNHFGPALDITKIILFKINDTEPSQSTEELSNKEK